ncbi:MAG: hypothetical protein ABI700_24425 [Chloroflexota bacterium]
MMIGRVSPQDEFSEFLMSKPTPDQIIAFHPSEAAEDRMRYLLDTNRNNRLSSEEEFELDHYLKLEHLMRMLKIKAREKLART